MLGGERRLGKVGLGCCWFDWEGCVFWLFAAKTCIAEGTTGMDCAFSVRGLSRRAGERDASLRWADPESKLGQSLA